MLPHGSNNSSRSAAWLAGHSFPVFGSTPSVFFTSPSGNALLEALMATGKFCMAFGTGASKHPKQSTVREVSGSDSLHISIGSDDAFDAHVDRYSPVPDPPGSAFCPNEPTPAAVGHIGRELIPGMVRKGVGTGAVAGAVAGLAGSGLSGAVVGGIVGGAAGAGGFQVFPDPGPPAPVPPGAVGPEPFRTSPGFSLGGAYSLLLSALLESSRVTVQGPLPKRPEPLVPPEAKRVSPDVGALPNEVVERIRHALEEQVSPEALLPSPVRIRLTEARRAAEMAGLGEEAALRRAREAAENEAADYADAHDVAFDLAVHMVQARRSQVTWVKLDLDRYGRYGGLDGNSRRFIVGEIRRIALILRNYLPDRAAGVNTVVAIFGAENLAVREEVKLPGWIEREKGIFD
jgi:hypothetical protein